MEIWSEERNYGLGSNLGGGKCGPGGETAAPGQALPCPSVVQGERNCGFGSNAGGGKCGPGREIMVLGQTLVAGNVVRGEKPRV